MTEDGLRERLAELEQQIADLHRGVSVAARADGANVVATGPGGIADAMKLVLSEMRREVPYDSCSVQELRGTRLVIVGGVGFADLDIIVGESFEIDNVDIPNGEVIYRRRPLLVADTEQYRAFRRGLHVGTGIRSWLGVPLIAGDALLGMLALDKAESNFYSQEQMRRAMEFASLLARAMLRGRNDDAAQSA